MNEYWENGVNPKRGKKRNVKNDTLNRDQFAGIPNIFVRTARVQDIATIRLINDTDTWPASAGL